MSPGLDLPTDEEIRGSIRALEPWRNLIRPSVTGIEHIPSKGGVLLVGNHTVWGLQDTILAGVEVLLRTGRPVHGLADSVHFGVPGWRNVVRRAGGIPASRETLMALLAMGRVALVFPGGAREINKRKGEKYQLMWKERVGFVRAAIATQATIVPFSAVGGEDNLDILVDHGSPLYAPARAIVTRLTGRDEGLPPLVRGLGPTPIPRPGRYYFRFAAPVDTSRWTGREEDPAALREARDETRAAVEAGVAALLDERERDPERSIARRLLRAVRRDED